MALFTLIACSSLFGKDEGDASESTDENVPSESGTPGSCEAGGYFEPDGFYEILPLAPIETYDVPEQDLRYLAYVPENPVAALWSFHGTGGGIDDLTQIEYLRIYNALIADGYAVIATESLERGPEAQWDHATDGASNNVDMVRIKWLWDYLVETTPLETTTPQFGTGFSNGAEFVAAWAFMGGDYGWDIRAIDCHNGSPNAFPKMDSWHGHSVNDDKDAVRGYEGMEEESPNKSHTLVYHEEVPLEEDRMITMGFTLEESLEIFVELVEMGIVDENGVRLVDIADVESVLNQYEDQTALPSGQQVTPVLRVVWATHRPNGDYNREIRNLFTCGNL